MTSNSFDYTEPQRLQGWLVEILSGRANIVEILDGETVVAEIHRASADLPTPTGWIAAGHYYDDNKLPPPFDTLRIESNNVGASVWIYGATGAMIAAVPSGPRDVAAEYKFYYAANATAAPMLMLGWSNAQSQWNGNDSTQYVQRHREAVQFFNSALSGTKGAASPGQP